MKVFIWYASQDPQNYNEGKRWVKIYAVAEDEPEARRKLDEVLPKQGVHAAMFRLALDGTKPQVFDVPFVEVNISDGRKSAAFVHGRKLV